MEFWWKWWKKIGFESKHQHWWTRKYVRIVVIFCVLWSSDFCILCSFWVSNSISMKCMCKRSVNLTKFSRTVNLYLQRHLAHKNRRKTWLKVPAGRQYRAHCLKVIKIVSWRTFSPAKITLRICQPIMNFNFCAGNSFRMINETFGAIFPTLWDKVVMSTYYYVANRPKYSMQIL